MEAIKNKNLPEITANLSCKFCKKSFRVEPKDILKDTTDSSTVGAKYYYECPYCKRKNDLSHEEFFDLSDEFITALIQRWW